MGFFNKLRNMFFEEEIIDTSSKEVKEEQLKVKQIVNEPKEAKDNMENIISERDLFKSETTFKFPVIFEEKDFLAEKKANKNVLDVEATLKEAKKEAKEKPKGFKVSPIISPIYGILDQNYRKEDVIAKEKAEKIPVIKEGKLDFDIVRKKAYGNLTDEIEQELEPTDNKGMFFNLKTEEAKTDLDDTNLLYEMSENREDLVVDDITIGSAEDNYVDFGLEYSNDRKIKEVAEAKDDDNLFDLIDSMYENKEE